MHDLTDLGHRLRASFVGRCVGTFAGMQGIDRAMVIASQAFTALIPLLILTSALAPVGSENGVSDAIVRKFALGGDAAAAVRQVFAHRGEGSTGALSVLLLVFSGFALARRMQRMYQQAWRLDAAAGVRGSVNAALGLGVLLIELALLALARTLVRGLPLDGVLGFTVSALAGIALWTSIPWLLLDRRLPWRQLVPAGVLASASTAVYGVATTVYMPRLIESYSQRYGLFGVTLALVGWLLAVSLIVVGAAVVAAELARAQDPWARRLRVRLRLEDAHSDGAVRDG